MKLIATLSFATTLVLGVWVSIALLRVASRTRQLPEAALGAAAMCLSLAGLLSAMPTISPSIRASQITPVSHMLYGLGAIATSMVTARIFRPHSRFARLASGALAGIESVAVVLILAGPAYVLDNGLLSDTPVRYAYLVSLCIRLTIYGWLSIEALLYFLEQRRGLRFGLSEPVIVHQFLGWAISSACMSFGVIGALVLRLATGAGVMGTPAGVLFFGLLGFVSALMLWLTFLPPRWYTAAMTRLLHADGG